MEKSRQAALVRALKRFNAKERDHLMRAAYLGFRANEEPSDYAESTRFLADSFDRTLQTLLSDKLGVDLEATPPRCVFAGMDYHLDWLAAALWLASNEQAWETEGRGSAVEMQKTASVESVSPLYTDFRTVMGNQEDVDLLVVYEIGDRLALLFIEAKGSAAFNKLQLARKLIRIDAILCESGAEKGGSNELLYLLVLASPNSPPDAFDCVTFASALPAGTPDKFASIRKALGDHRSELGKGIHHVPLPQYPKELIKVERIPDAAPGERTYSSWTILRRKAGQWPKAKSPKQGA